METTPPQPGLALRILRYPLVLMVVEFAAIILAATLASTIGHKVIHAKNTPLDTLGGVFVALATIGAYIVLRHALEGHKGENEFALPGAARELGSGLLLGTALFCGAAGIVALLGGFTITGTRFPGDLWSLLAMAVVSGVTEETLFRGIAFRHLESLLGSWGALAITSAFFGIAHITNPHATWFSSLAIALEAGVLLGGAYMLTRRLWAAVGIHAAWNFTQGWIFSVPVSGSRPPLGYFISTRSGPEWLTGGDFGLEASVFAMVVATGAGVLLVVMALRKGRVLAPVWRRG